MFLVKLFGIVLLIITPITTTTVAKLLPYSQLQQHRDNSAFVKLLQIIKYERNFENLLILSRRTSDCFVEPTQMDTRYLTKFLLSADGVGVYLKGFFNSEILALVCMQSVYDTQLLDVLANTLHHMRQSRIIFLLKNFRNIHTINNSIFRYCLNKQMINVMIVHDNYRETKLFYNLLPFGESLVAALPIGKLFNITNSTEAIIFPQHWRNMRGKTILTLVDQIEPRSMVYIDRFGEKKLRGYVARLIRIFAKKYNATLQHLHALKVDEVTHFSELRQFTVNGTIDLAISLVPISHYDDFLSLTYPIEIGKWMTMVPRASALPTSDIYLVIMDSGFLLMLLWLIVCFSALHASLAWREEGRFKLLNLIINDKVVRGIFGQASVWHHSPDFIMKLLYLLIFLSGLIFSTLYAAHLKTLLTSHPSQKEIMNGADLQKRQLKLLIADTERSSLLEICNSSSRLAVDMIKTGRVVSYHDFVIYRRKMNPSYAYPVSTSLWPIFEVQQEFYSRKIFHIPHALTFAEFVMFSVPLQLNSIYREPLDILIHGAHEAGLMKYWYTLTYFDMVEAGRVSFVDINRRTQGEYIVVEDLYWVWLILAVGWVLSVIIFCIEIILGKHFARG